VWGCKQYESTKSHAVKAVRLCEKYIFLHTYKPLLRVDVLSVNSLPENSPARTSNAVPPHQGTSKHIKHRTSAHQMHIKPRIKKNSESTSGKSLAATNCQVLVLLSIGRGMQCGLGGSLVIIPLTRTDPRTRTHTVPMQHAVPPLTHTNGMMTNSTCTEHEQRTCTHCAERAQHTRPGACMQQPVRPDRRPLPGILFLFSSEPRPSLLQVSSDWSSPFRPFQNGRSARTVHKRASRST
jgi:hypothetical protein